MIAATQSRVEHHTRARFNERIEREAIHDIERAIEEQRIDERLAELDREWDTERTLQTNFSIVALVTLGLARRDRRWLELTALASVFMLQHALQGWCPPLALFRRMGIRTSGEIERERAALLALRASDAERAR